MEEITQPSQKLRITHLKCAFAWLGFLVFFSVLNETVFNVALPDFAKQFQVEPSTANWVNTGFILSFAIGSFVYGKISDLYGIKKMLMIGIVTYGSGSMLGLAAHAYLPALIAARFIQGAGASAIPALVMVMIVRYFDANHRGRAFGLIGSLVSKLVQQLVASVFNGYRSWKYDLYIDLCRKKKQTNLKHGSIFVIQIPVSLVTTERAGFFNNKLSYAIVPLLY